MVPPPIPPIPSIPPWSCWASTNNGKRHIREVNAGKDIVVAVVKISSDSDGGLWELRVI